MPGHDKTDQCEYLRVRYLELGHAMQSGVAMMMQCGDGKETTPKHLRTGINSAMVEHSAVLQVLLKKGVVTEAEYYESLCEMMRKEVQLYEEAIEKATGKKVLLA